MCVLGGEGGGGGVKLALVGGGPPKKFRASRKNTSALRTVYIHFISRPPP